MKVTRAEFEPPELTNLPETIKGQPVAAYKLGNIIAGYYEELSGGKRPN